VREWESHFTGEFGWPRTCVFRYALRPHAAGWTSLERAQAAAAFDQKPRCVVLPPQPGALPTRQGFVAVEGQGAQLSAFRRPSADAADCELRVVECAGQAGSARVRTALPLTSGTPVDAMGRTQGSAAALAGAKDHALRPWEIRNFILHP
jgi:alpha-mannosidase